MQTDRVLLEGSIEHIIKTMTPEERGERVRQLREKARRREYLPQYREQQQMNGATTIDAKAIEVDEPEGEKAQGETEAGAGLGSRRWIHYVLARLVAILDLSSRRGRRRGAGLGWRSMARVN